MTTTVPAGRYGDYSTAFIQAYIDAKIAGVLDSAPETLNTLNEIAAAISDDPAFFTTMATANSTLQSNIDSVQSTLQAAINAVQSDVDGNESDGDAAITLEISNRAAALTALQTTIQGLIDAVQADVDQNESDSDAADAVLSGRLDTLEADPTTATAVAAVQADVDANEAAADAAIALLAPKDGPVFTGVPAAPTAALGTNTGQLATTAFVTQEIGALVDGAPGAINTLNELAAALNDDADFATTVTNSIAAVQADVNQNETDADAAIAAVQADVDQNESDADAAIAALQADVDQNEADADAAIALRALAADSILTGTTEAKGVLNIGNDGLNSGYYLKIQRNGNTQLDLLARNIPSGGNLNITNSNANNARVVVYSDEFWVRNLGGSNGNGKAKFDGDVTFGDGIIASGGLTDAADDTAAAAAGVAVGQLYRNGSVVMIRVS